MSDTEFSAERMLLERKRNYTLTGIEDTKATDYIVRLWDGLTISYICKIIEPGAADRESLIK